MVYDVVVVGAGSAGSVVAARASEDPNRSVLLVEAGPDYAAIDQTPFDLVNSHNNSYTDHDWGFEYEPTQGRRMPFPRGRVTGSSSSVNTTIALRGMPEDFDEWAANGCPAWSWDSVLPAFNRLERDLDFGTEAYHGDAGPITIRRYPDRELLPQHQAFLASATDLGYPACADANDPGGWGAGPQPMNKLGRLRVSCAIGYLAPARIRPNLEIRPHTLARRLVFQGDRCSGIEVETAGDVDVIETRLVVLCTGALMTPPLLVRSGLGPKPLVEGLGIDLVGDLPGVGQNLSDHPALGIRCAIKDGSIIDFDQPLIQTILRYTAAGSDKRNDLQIEQISFSGRSDAEAAFAVAAVLEYQYGRGELRIESADPRHLPIADNRFCEDPRDAERLAGCVRDALAFTRDGPLADMIERVEFPDAARGLSDEELVMLCRRFSGSGYHPCGTAKMGDERDTAAVVDQYGRCRRVQGVVVADASIMPSVPRANTNLTSIMIGEHVGEWLRTAPARYGL